MIEVGEHAPAFALPAVEDGEVIEIDLASIFGSEVVILAFYPGDFNPACSGSETGLDELDLFTMQKDVQVLAVSADSVHSHQAFAEEYNLHMPLLSDTDGEMAEAYGVTAEDGHGYLTRRAVVVVDHTGTVQYTWESERPSHVPTAEEIRRAVEEIGDDETAESRYRVGYAHYMEGRRAFTSAMKAYESQEWMMAQTDFTQACDEFDAAGDEFNTATRFAESDKTRVYFDRAEEKAESLWRAADWLAESASAFASGQGAKADSLRRDAEAPLETARDLHEPPEPDDFPPDEDPAERDEEPVHPLADNDDEPAATLDADIDDQLDTDVEEADPAQEATNGEQSDGIGAADGEQMTADNEPATTEDEEDDDEASEIDDEELEEITAELEEQSEAAAADPEDEKDEQPAVPEEPGIERDEETDEDVELELTDPTDEGDSDEDDQKDDDETLTDDTGDHGVPDSL